MKRSIVLSVAALVSFVSLASAQPTPAVEPRQPPAKAQSKVKVLDMTAEDVNGDVPTGELVPIGVRTFGKSSSLIRIRHDFIDMILKSAEDLT